MTDIEKDVAGVMDLAMKWASHPFSTKNRVALEAAIRALAVRQTKALTVDELEALWNAQADKFNQWADLGLDEIVYFAQAVHGIKETP